MSSKPNHARRSRKTARQSKHGLNYLYQNNKKKAEALPFVPWFPKHI